MTDTTPMKREEHTLDATDQSMGRLASQIAMLLMGKNKPQYERHMDTGDTVIVQNVKQMKLTGKKMDQKIYYRNTGFPGGIRTKKAGDLLNNAPAELLRMCVTNMLPDTKLRNSMLKRLIIE